ncbi:MAG: tRNA lysidine(34) synthetase TilS [Pseudomonadota bacterium]|nr:tRNA lysidine(34) synthetase TilS [Pseudomonadota bacterium]
MNQKFIKFMNEFSGQKLAVAVSGGVDSVCLLCWLADMGLRPIALHVNHGLRDVAAAEAQYVQDLCAARGIECHVFEWTGDKPATGLEAAARNARYKMMTDFCRKNNVDALLVAHQADDQIETFLMNLGRGSGLSGLAAMRPVSVRDGVKIVRPLLNVWRRELKQYCDDNGIKYCTDAMNSDAKYTRVRIRQNRHLMADALGISDERILLAINNLNRVRDAIETNVADLVATVKNGRRAVFLDSFLFDQDDNIRLKFIGTLIQQIGGDNYQPRLNSLRRALSYLGGDCKFTLGHCTVRRLGNRILIVPEGAKTSFRTRHGKTTK